MSKEDLAALAATAEERQTANLRKWLAMPEVREFLNESARQMRETVRVEMRAEAEGRRPARLSDAELDYVKRQAAAGVAREEHMNAEAIKWLAAHPDELTKAQ